MKQFLVFTQKEFYHIFRDRWTSLVLLVLPILMIILFGFGISTEIKNTKFAVYDPSRDISTQAIINKMKSSDYFTLEQYIDDPGEIENIFKQGKIGFMVVFSEKFYQNILPVSYTHLTLPTTPYV